MFKDKLKNFANIKNDEQNLDNKKKLENMIFLVIILIVTIVLINYIWSGNKTKENQTTNSAGKQLASLSNSSNDGTENSCDSNNSNSSNNLEQRLKSILGNINGVGKVEVFINYSESTETVAMYNENSKTSVTEETDTSGGTRKIEQKDSDKEIVYQEDDGNKIPIVQKTIQPKIEGAIITAEGASDINVKTNIIQAVEAATGLATHKIQVFEMQNNN